MTSNWLYRCFLGFYFHWSELVAIIGKHNFDLGWLLDAHPAAVPLFLVNRMEEENKLTFTFFLEIRRGSQLMDYHHRQNRLNLGEIDFIFS